MPARLAAAGLLLWSLGAAAQAPPATGRDLPRDDLATGPYATMQMLLEKTIFRVDVLTVDVQFDEATAGRLRSIAAGRSYSDALEPQVVEAAASAENVYVRLSFLRNVALPRWVEGVDEGLERAWRTGMIEESSYRAVVAGLPVWFSAIADRGFLEGDQLRYRGRPDGLRTMLVSRDGQVLVDHDDGGAEARQVLLAGYFARGTDFREPLVRSLFD